MKGCEGLQVEVKTVNSTKEERALICAVTVSDEIQSAIDMLENSSRSIPVISNGETMICRTDKIYYFESVDKRTYLYTKENCYETRYKLYELDDLLSKNFIRCAKAMIINIRKIKSVKSEVNGRMTAQLLNGEQVIIARNYVKDLKERLGI